ncbi:MAG TPA: hypothetical protein PLO45_03335 [Defluviitoga sp.]|nr:hypothetical protein [Defluviitoga sp.]
MWARYVSFFILSVSMLYLVISSIIFSFKFNLTAFFLLLFFVFGILYALVAEFKSIKTSSKSNSGFNFLSFVSVIVGALSTYFLNIYLDQGSIIAASLIGIIGSIFFPKYSLPIYTGAFVGMISPDFSHNFYHICAACIIAGFIYELSKEIFVGTGGKLGTIAFSSWVITYLLFNLTFLHPAFNYKIGYELFLISFVGTITTYLLHNFFLKDVVLSSALISLMGALILPVLFPNLKNISPSLMMAATFAGMSSIKRENFYKITFTSLVVPVFFICSYCSLGGVGGKLGTIAFSSVLTVEGIFNLLKDISSRN